MSSWGVYFHCGHSLTTQQVDQLIYLTAYQDSVLWHPLRYQQIWRIYIPFESPLLVDFRNARFDLNFCRNVMPCSAMYRQLVFSRDIAA